MKKSLFLLAFIVFSLNTFIHAQPLKSELLPQNSLKRPSSPIVDRLMADYLVRDNVQKIEVPNNFHLFNKEERDKYFQKINKKSDRVEFVSNKSGKLIYSMEKDEYATPLMEAFYQSKFISDSISDGGNKTGCCSGGVCKIKPKEFSCDEIENSLVEDEINSDLYKTLSTISLSTTSSQGKVKKGTKYYCDNCYKKAFDSLDDKKSFEEIQNDILEKVKYQKIKSKVKNLVLNHIALKSYYNENKEAIKRALHKENEYNRNIFSEKSSDLLYEELRGEKLCLKFGHIGTKLEGSQINGGDPFGEEVDFDFYDSLDPKKCASGSTKVFSQIQKDLSNELDGFKGGLDLANQEVFDYNSGVAFNESVEKYTDRELQRLEIDKEKATSFVNRYIGEMSGNLKKNFTALKDVCLADKSEKSYKKPRILISLLGDLVDEKDVVKKYKGVLRVANKISIVDPNLLPILSDTSEVCRFLSTKTNKEDIELGEFADFISLSSIKQQDRKDKEILDRLNRLSSSMCGNIERNIPSLICSNEDHLTDKDFMNFSLDGEGVSSADQIGLASLKCRFDTPEVPGLSPQSVTSKSRGIASINEDIDFSDVDAESIQQEQRSNIVNDSSSDYLDSNKDFVHKGSDIDIEDRNAGRLTGKDIVEASKAPESKKPAVSETRTRSVSTSNTLDENEPEVESSFSTKMKSVLDTSRNISSIGSFNSQGGMNSLMNTEVSSTDVMSTLTENEDVANSFKGVQEQLEDKLISDENVNEKLTNTILGKDDIDATDLKCSSPVKSVCDDENAELLKEIAKLQAQIDASAKAKKVEESEPELNKRISELEKELERFKRIENAKVDTTSARNPAISSSGVDNNGFIQGGSSLSGNNNSNLFSQNNNRASISESPKSSVLSNQLLASIKNDPESFIKSNDFALDYKGDQLVLTVVGKNLLDAPVSLENIIVDDSDNVRQIVLDGGKPITLENLSVSSREAVERFINANKQLTSTKGKVLLKEKDSLVEVRDTINSEAKSAAVRYNQLLSCLESSSLESCKK